MKGKRIGTNNNDDEVVVRYAQLDLPSIKAALDDIKPDPSSQGFFDDQFFDELHNADDRSADKACNTFELNPIDTEYFGAYSKKGNPKSTNSLDDINLDDEKNSERETTNLPNYIDSQYFSASNVQTSIKNDTLSNSEAEFKEGSTTLHGFMEDGEADTLNYFDQTLIGVGTSKVFPPEGISDSIGKPDTLLNHTEKQSIDRFSTESNETSETVASDNIEHK